MLKCSFIVFIKKYLGLLYNIYSKNKVFTVVIL